MVGEDHERNLLSYSLFFSFSAQQDAQLNFKVTKKIQQRSNHRNQDCKQHAPGTRVNVKPH